VYIYMLSPPGIKLCYLPVWLPDHQFSLWSTWHKDKKVYKGVIYLYGSEVAEHAFLTVVKLA